MSGCTSSRLWSLPRGGLLVDETLQSVRDVAATLTVRANWEPLPAEARAALDRLRPGNAPPQWTVGLTPGDAEQWKALKVYLPYDLSATLRFVEKVVWRAHASSGLISVLLTEERARELAEWNPELLRVTPASEARPGRGIRPRGGLVRSHGAWLRRYLGSAGGAAPWGALIALGGAGVLGALVGPGGRPGIPGAGIGMAVLGGYCGLAMLFDWFRERRER